MPRRVLANRASPERLSLGTKRLFERGETCVAGMLLIWNLGGLVMSIRPIYGTFFDERLQFVQFFTERKGEAGCGVQLIRARDSISDLEGSVLGVKRDGHRRRGWKVRIAGWERS